jgi:two-component system response regulator DesR
MRATRAVYIENDPALRGMISAALSRHPEIELLLATDSAGEALDSDAVRRADVALIDLALGWDQMNGLDLGVALRGINDNLGIVIYSQHPLAHLEKRVPESMRMGWSFFPKRVDMDVANLVELIRLTAAGFSRDATPEGAEEPANERATDLSAREQAIMSLAASGMSATAIARKLDLSHDRVRKDLSNSYKKLVPDARAGDDVRVRAILAYLSLASAPEWNDS